MKRLLILTTILCLLCACGGGPSTAPDEQGGSLDDMVTTEGGTLSEGEEDASAEDSEWQNPLSDAEFIMHAGGLINGDRLTNSLEALENAVSHGQNFIEVDFRFSSDGYLVCTHDFPNAGIESRDEYLSEKLHKDHGDYTPMDFDLLAAFMKKNRDFYVISDIKDDNVEGCKMIAETYPELRDRFIIQIYHQDEYEPIRELGFRNIIYTIYNEPWEVKITPVDILRFAEEHRLCCITYPAEMDDYVENYTTAMLMSDVRLFVHTVNDPAEAAYWLSRGVGLYTDVVDTDGLLESAVLGV